MVLFLCIHICQSLKKKKSIFTEILPHQYDNCDDNCNTVLLHLLILKFHTIFVFCGQKKITLSLSFPSPPLSLLFFPAPCSLLPAPCYLLPTPFSLLPSPCSLLPPPLAQRSVMIAAQFLITLKCPLAQEIIT